MALELGQERIWHPFGMTHPLTAIHVDTIVNTWVALGVIVLLIIMARIFLRGNNLGNYFVKSIVKAFMQMVKQAAGKDVHKYYLFIASLFSFILICNWVALLPFIGEPTKDINTTLAFGICAFVYIQKEIIQAHGVVALLCLQSNRA